jgi:hypothetical protein
MDEASDHDDNEGGDDDGERRTAGAALLQAAAGRCSTIQDCARCPRLAVAGHAIQSASTRGRGESVT